MANHCDHESLELYEHGNVSTDGSGPVSRSSVIHVAYIVGKFDDMKKDLVRQIGFGGILHVPHITKVDRKFTLWLLTKLDPEKRCIVVNDQSVSELIDFDVTRIMGIPCGRRQVCHLNPADKKSKLDFVQNFIGSTDPDVNSLTAAENIVKAQYHPEMCMTLKDKDNFKVAFVVWVMGHLLAPTKKHNVGSDRFWGALVSPDEISQFNWAAYVIDELILAAIDVQNTLKQKKPVNNITGCPIVLQILYFDSIHMGSLNRPRGVLPRVKAYDAKSLSLMIAADKASSASSSANATWGASVRFMPEEPDETHDRSAQERTDAPNTVSPTEDKIILDLGKYVRDRFGGKVSAAQSISLNWFHTRIAHHYSQMRIAIQKDTIELVSKLFGPPIVLTTGVPSEHPLPNCKEAKQSISEPSRPPTYGRTLSKNKRGYESSTSCHKRRAAKKLHVSFRQHALPETLLSGMSVSDEHELGDQLSDNGYPSRDRSHNLGCNIEVPSFDLGVEFNTEVNQDPRQPSSDKVDLCSPVILQSSKISATANLSTTFNEISPADKITMVSIVSLNETSDNSVATDDDKCAASSTPGYIKPITSTPPSVKSVQELSFTSPDQRIKNCKTSPRTLSKILAEGELVERMTRSEDIPNINIRPWDDDYSDTPVEKRIVDTPNMVESPWNYNLFHRVPPKDIVENLFEDVSQSNYTVLNRPWLAHTSPRHIELDGTWIHNSFILQKGLCYDTCDLAIRRLKQLDDMMYGDSSIPHWRHILESEFAMFALAGEIAYNRNSIIQQFVGSSIRYKLEDCRMIIVPAYILLNWSSYFFDFKDSCIHVIDPLYNQDQSDLFSKMHLPNVMKVATLLGNCFKMFFKNCHHKFEQWPIKFVQPSISDATSSETGLLTLMYIRQFDGSNINLVNRESFLSFQKLMLYELMCLCDNPVRAPVNLMISIDD